MAYLAMLPAWLSALMLGAHFGRSGNLILIGVSLAIIPLSILPWRWAARVAQLLLMAGAAVWLWTMAQLVQVREELGQPWVRLVIILGSVMAFTALSALLLEVGPVRRRYLAGASESPPIQ